MRREIIEQQSASILSFLRWAYEEQQWQHYLRLYLATRSLLNMVPLHRERIEYPRWAAEAAQILGEHETQIRSLLKIARIYVYYREEETAQQVYDQAQKLAQSVSLNPQARSRVNKRLGTTKILLLIYTDQVMEARHLIAALLPYAQSPKHASELSYYNALCFHKLGEDEEAESMLITLLAQQDNDIGSMSLCRACTTLAEIYLAAKNDHAAHQVIERNLATAIHMRDRYQIARARKNLARLHTLRGDIPAARVSLVEAIDLFERLGMRHELAEARAELAGMDAPDAPMSGASGA